MLVDDDHVLFHVAFTMAGLGVHGPFRSVLMLTPAKRGFCVVPVQDRGWRTRFGSGFCCRLLYAVVQSARARQVPGSAGCSIGCVLAAQPPTRDSSAESSAPHVKYCAATAVRWLCWGSAVGSRPSMARHHPPARSASGISCAEGGRYWNRAGFEGIDRRGARRFVLRPGWVGFWHGHCVIDLVVLWRLVVMCSVGSYVQWVPY